MSTLLVNGLLPEFGRLTPDIAERWVGAALAHAEALRAYDGWLFPTDPGRQAAAERLHEAWRCWADDAQSILREADSLTANENQIPGLDELRKVVRQTRATLRLTPALIVQRCQQVERGEVYSIEEVRRSK
jgi:hypothetical protein